MSQVTEAFSFVRSMYTASDPPYNLVRVNNFKKTSLPSQFTSISTVALSTMIFVIVNTPSAKTYSHPFGVNATAYSPSPGVSA